MGRELYTRLNTLSDHYGKVGHNLEKAVEAYNATLSSLDSRVGVTARKLHEMDIPGRTDRTRGSPCLLIRGLAEIRHYKSAAFVRGNSHGPAATGRIFRRVTSQAKKVLRRPKLRSPQHRAGQGSWAARGNLAHGRVDFHPHGYHRVGLPRVPRHRLTAGGAHRRRTGLFLTVASIPIVYAITVVLAGFFITKANLPEGASAFSKTAIVTAAFPLSRGSCGSSLPWWARQSSPGCAGHATARRPSAPPKWKPLPAEPTPTKTDATARSAYRLQT